MKSPTKFIIVLFCLINCSIFAQTETKIEQKEKTVKVAFFDGTVVAGYVDQGAFLNCMGPNISFTKGKSRFVLGMLPSLRFKEDKSTMTRNSPVTPNLGAGLTYSFKKIAFQLPLYYNAKTTTSNGKWVVGVGIGYRFK